MAEEGDGVRPREPGRGVGESALEEGRAEGDGEGVEVPSGTLAPAFGKGIQPDLEDGPGDLGRLPEGLMGDADGHELVPHVLAEAPGGILVEPLRQEIVGGVALGLPAVGCLDLHAHVEQGKARERDEAVPEGQPRLEVPDVERGGLEREPYRNAGMTSLVMSSSSRMMWRCAMPGKKRRQMRCVRPYSLTNGSRAFRTWSGPPMRKRSRTSGLPWHVCRRR